MNYPGMRSDIVELFALAQRPLVDQLRVHWARAVSETPAYQYGPTPARVTTEPCPLCGGTFEIREGNPRPIHIGICSR